MRRDLHDAAWGGVLALVGLAVAAWAAAYYDFGGLRRMGPGFFPVVLGLILAALGLLVAVPALGRPGMSRHFAWPETVGVVGALLVFGLLLNRAGLVPTTALTVLIASAVAPRRGIVWRLVLTIAVTALTWVLFIGGLDMPIPAWPRSF
ncbi:tripartite tricarboxylate transporter TctB family protein [Paracoccus rhizosphaerae]|uniref:Tripartite tricarboxylate transporter TctB family protein n=1 Tax=Paracoccus rhizosphaerae TaxID=1133347 RepID=A0ABV6CDR5_9RHOB|nr:tripartite tricarboxylate transporter TctB family protein [Paracoccus rhizosphaerae]